MTLLHMDKNEKPESELTLFTAEVAEDGEPATDLSPQRIQNSQRTADFRSQGKCFFTREVQKTSLAPALTAF
jgi:hypothetical protein